MFALLEAIQLSLALASARVREWVWGNLISGNDPTKHNVQINVEVEVWGNLISGNRHYICMKIKYFGQSLIIDLSEINSPAKQTYLAYILPSFGSSNLQVAPSCILPCTRDAKTCKLHCRVREWVWANLISGNNPTKHIRVCARNWSNWREWITELWSEYARVSCMPCMRMTLCTDWTCVDHRVTYFRSLWRRLSSVRNSIHTVQRGISVSCVVTGTALTISFSKPTTVSEFACLRFHKFILQSHIYCFAFCRLIFFFLWLDLNLNSQSAPSWSRPMIV